MNLAHQDERRVQGSGGRDVSMAFCSVFFVFGGPSQYKGGWPCSVLVVRRVTDRRRGFDQKPRCQVDFSVGQSATHQCPGTCTLATNELQRNCRRLLFPGHSRSRLPPPSSQGPSIGEHRRSVRIWFAAGSWETNLLPLLSMMGRDLAPWDLLAGWGCGIGVLSFANQIIARIRSRDSL